MKTFPPHHERHGDLHALRADSQGGRYARKTEDKIKLIAALADGVSPGGYRTGRTDGEEKEGGTVELGRDAPKLPVDSGPGGAPPTFHWYW
jgi:hypothetical protein